MLLPFAPLLLAFYVVANSPTAYTTARTICPLGMDQALSECEVVGHHLSDEACARIGGCVSQDSICRLSPVPSLDDLAGAWQNVSDVYSHPSAEGFWGGVATTENLLSFEGGTFPPVSQGGESLFLTIDGFNATATWARWYPYQVVRMSQIGELVLTSTLRMGFERNAILLQLDLTNVGAQNIQPELKVDLRSYWRFYAGTWPWTTPRPNDSANFTTSSPDASTILTVDSQSSASAAISMSFEPQFTMVNASDFVGTISPLIGPGSTQHLFVAVAVTNKSSMVTTQEAKWALSNYSALWAESLDLWSERYQNVFESNNTFFSGSLPVLATNDTSMSKLWYHSATSILSTMRTNLQYPRVYATVGPDYGTTIVYAWDTSLWSGILVLLDPDFLKQQIQTFLSRGVYSGYAVDYLTKRLVGPWYSANDFAIFTTMIRYLNMTGDYAWLQQPAANGSTNLEQLRARATHWKTLENQEFGLADYGDLSNLLEEVPTYTNMVPSLNAANVWMMNQYSNLLAATGNATGAEIYTDMASDLADIVLATYAGPGAGYWLTTYPNGTREAVRHVYDFNIFSLYLSPLLNSSVKSDMLSFLHNELYTGYWLRALSVDDLVANVSMRPDHGSNGAYASWPALAAGGVSQLGDYDAMITYLRAFSSVLNESTWAQCYQLIDPLGPAAASGAEAAASWAAEISDFSGTYFGGENGTAPAGLANKARVSLPDQGETFNENNGASFADVILSYLFGWNPDGKGPVIRDAEVARRDFIGRLVGVRGPGGKYYTIDVGPQGVTNTETEW